LTTGIDDRPATADGMTGRRKGRTVPCIVKKVGAVILRRDLCAGFTVPEGPSSIAASTSAPISTAISKK